jgi:hypothetical protein
MRYFHRTSLSPDEVLENADKHFASMGAVAESGARSRTFKGTVGQITLHVEPEGGHYTRVTVEIDQRCQGEADKFVKSFFKVVHSKAHAAHV